MVKICAVKNCESGRISDRMKRSKDNMRNATHFQVPKCPVKRQKWIDALSQDLKQGQCICDLHFLEKDIKKGNEYAIHGNIVTIPNEVWHLRNGAIPVIERPLQEQQVIEHDEHQIKLECDVIEDNQPAAEPQHLDCRSPEENLMEVDTECKYAISRLSFDNIKDHFTALMPQGWSYIAKDDVFTMILLDSCDFQEKIRLRLSMDLMLMVTFSRRKEIQSGIQITSLDDLYEYMRDAKRHIMCTGTGMKNKRYASQCIGMLHEGERYQRLPRCPRCRACRELRRKMQTNIKDHRNIARTILVREKVHRYRKRCRRFVTKAQEYPEVLRFLIGPLEDQIQALKETLRATDEELQRYHECEHREQDRHDHNVSTNSSFDSPQHATSCDMCSNYEDQLVAEQKKTTDFETNVQMAEKAVERNKEDLLKEIGFKRKIEENWIGKKEEHKQQVAELTRSTKRAEQDLKEPRQMFQQTCNVLNDTIKKLTEGRERIYEELTTLQKQNDTLIGKHAIHSQKIQSEAINLPNTVEELHNLVLKHHQDFINAKIGKEATEEKVNTLQSDILLLRDQMTNDRREKERIENNLAQEIDLLKKQKHQLEKETKLYLANQEKLENSDKANLAKIEELQKQVHDVLMVKKQLEEQNSELRTRVSSLQQELETSETVQKDFVRLSQSLKVHLEKIRESDTQHEENIKEFSNCDSGIKGSKGSLKLFDDEKNN